MYATKILTFFFVPGRCIDRWVLQSLGSQAPNAAPACPVCKAPILRVGCDAGVEADDGVDSESADELTYITDDVEVNLV